MNDKSKGLRARMIRLAYERPDLRPVLLPLLKTASIQGWEQIPRGEYIDQIWEMYTKTYAKLGLSKGSKQELVSDYDIWEISRGPDSNPIAFVVSKGTALGTKLGLAGSDGTSRRTSFASFSGSLTKAEERSSEA